MMALHCFLGFDGAGKAYLIQPQGEPKTQKQYLPLGEKFKTRHQALKISSPEGKLNLRVTKPENFILTQKNRKTLQGSCPMCGTPTIQTAFV